MGLIYTMCIQMRYQVNSIWFEYKQQANECKIPQINSDWTLVFAGWRQPCRKQETITQNLDQELFEESSPPTA